MEVKIMYTMETLEKINQCFIATHYELTESDVEAVNEHVELIEKSRSESKPKEGDLLIYTDENGEYYPRAHIETFTTENGNELAYICEKPYVPFVWECSGDINCSTSGGAWKFLQVKDLKYKGKTEKLFSIVGHCGLCAHAALYFKANVNVWEYVSPDNPYRIENEVFTTKDYDKYYISYNSKPDEYGYKFQSILEGEAWKTELEFQAWLRTLRGVVFKGNFENSMVVFTWKAEEYHVSPKEFEELVGFEDVLMCNGLQRCKRVYDEQNHVVKSYFVWYWDEEPKENETYSEFHARQNEIRNKYYSIDWRRGQENERAIREIKSGAVEKIDLSEFTS